MDDEREMEDAIDHSCSSGADVGETEASNEPTECPVTATEASAKQTLDPNGTSQVSSEEQPMSKRKRKRLAHKERKKLYLKDIRVKERERKKLRIREARAQGKDIGPSRKALKHNTMAKSACRVRAAIDCSFDNLMTEKDIKSIVKQLNFCYAANRRAMDPLQFYVTSFGGQLKTIMDSIGDYYTWDVHLEQDCYLDIFDKSSIVYLTSDSKNILHQLDEEKVYIIGGLVDHNHHKGLSLQLAEEHGLSHAQLPLGDYVTLESRNILTVNHVFEILLRFTESHDWTDAFYKVIPRRKGVVPLDYTDRGSTPLDHTDKGGTPLDHTDRDSTPLDHTDEGSTPLDHTDKGGTPLDHADEGDTPLDHIDEGVTPINDTDKSVTPPDLAKESCTPFDYADKSDTPLHHTDEGGTPLDHANNGVTPPHADKGVTPLDYTNTATSRKDKDENALSHTGSGDNLGSDIPSKDTIIYQSENIDNTQSENTRMDNNGLNNKIIKTDYKFDTTDNLDSNNSCIRKQVSIPLENSKCMDNTCDENSTGFTQTHATDLSQQGIGES